MGSSPTLAITLAVVAVIHNATHTYYKIHLTFSLPLLSLIFHMEIDMKILEWKFKDHPDNYMSDWYDTTGELKLVLKIDKIIQFEPTELANGRRPSIAAYHPLPLVSSMAILIFLLALSQ